MARKRLCGAFAAIAASFCGNTVLGDEAGQCARLFKEQAVLDTCNTLLRMSAGKLSDSVLRERVSQSVYGMSANELEKDRPRREEANRKINAEKEAAEIAEDPQCYRLFVVTNERKECRLLRALTAKERTDDEMREVVRARLGSIHIDEEHTRAAIQAEEKRKREAKEAEERSKQAATVEAARREDEAKRAAKENERRREDAKIEEEKREKAAMVEEGKRKKAAIVEEQRRKDRIKRAAEELDAQLKRGAIGFLLGDWVLGGFGTVMSIRFTLQNNTSTSLKDFVIGCETSGKSGTHLSSPRRTLYESLQPGARHTFELSMGFVHSQSASASCSVVKWTNG